MILTVTPNPCLHKIVTFHGELDGRMVIRPVDSRWQGGGKGVNAARAIRTLGGAAIALSTFGGSEGRLFADGLTAEGVAFDGVEVARPTRMSTFLFGADTGRLREFVEPGLPLAADERERFERRFLERLQDAAIVTLNGSVAGGEQDDLHAWCAARARDAKKRVIVDTYGKAAVLAARERPTWWKANLEESSASFGVALEKERAIVEFARALRKDGIEFVLLTAGEKGAWLFGPDGEHRVLPPRVKEVSPIGCGDAMLGAVAFALERGADALSAVKLGSAAGAANAARLGVCDFAKTDVDALVGDVKVEKG